MFIFFLQSRILDTDFASQKSGGGECDLFFFLRFANRMMNTHTYNEYTEQNAQILVYFGCTHQAIDLFFIYQNLKPSFRIRIDELSDFIPIKNDQTTALASLCAPTETHTRSPAFWNFSAITSAQGSHPFTAWEEVGMGLRCWPKTTVVTTFSYGKVRMKRRDESIFLALKTTAIFEHDHPWNSHHFGARVWSWDLP